MGEGIGTDRISSLIIPLLLVLVCIAFLRRKRDSFSDFLEGARTGARSCILIFPSLLALIAALTIFSASGLAEAISGMLAPLGEKIGIPSVLFTLILVRPISGSGSIAAYADLIERYGADSFVGLCASVIVASSDTLIYIAAVYFSAAKIKKTRYTLPVGLFVSLFSVLFSCFICRLLYE